MPKFNQNKQIYLTLFEKYKDDKTIQEHLATSSFTNFEINNFVELIKTLKDEEIKNSLFNNLGKEIIINHEDFLNKEESKNLKLLSALMGKKLIPENISYFTDNKDMLKTIFEKLSKFKEKKKFI